MLDINDISVLPFRDLAKKLLVISLKIVWLFNFVLVNICGISAEVSGPYFSTKSIFFNIDLNSLFARYYSERRKLILGCSSWQNWICFGKQLTSCWKFRCKYFFTFLTKLSIFFKIFNFAHIFRIWLDELRFLTKKIIQKVS